MPEPCNKRFLWTHTEVDLAPHPVVGLVLQEGDAEKFSQALSVESLDPGSRMQKHNQQSLKKKKKKLSSTLAKKRHKTATETQHGVQKPRVVSEDCVQW